MSEPWKPAPYQLRAVKFLLSRGAGGLFLLPGLRKTSISLAAFSAMHKAKVVKRMLVIAPKRPTYFVWPAEVKKWKDFEHLKVVVLHGGGKNKALTEKADIYVINYDGLEWLLKTNVIQNRFFDVLVCDESHKLKSTKTKRFKLLKSVLKYFRRRWILTGSPRPKGLLDLFGQIFVLDMGASLGRYITHYRMQYFTPSGYNGYDWVPNVGADKAIAKKIAPLVLQMTDTEYVKLPKLMTYPELQPIYVDMPHTARRVYKEMENLLITQIASGEVTAANAAVASMKCRQIANGGLYITEASLASGGVRRWELIHNEKTDAVIDLLEELNGMPALISYDFNHDLARLKIALGENIPTLPARNMREEGLICDAWNTGNMTTLLGNPQSVALGLNLQGGRVIVWHSMTWNYEHYDQFIRRVYRSGQKDKVFVYHIIARDTIDEVMLEVAQQRATGQNGFFNLLRKYTAQKLKKSQRA
jgi:hypothetical protein